MDEEILFRAPKRRKAMKPGKDEAAELVEEVGTGVVRPGREKQNRGMRFLNVPALHDERSIDAVTAPPSFFATRFTSGAGIKDTKQKINIDTEQNDKDIAKVDEPEPIGGRSKQAAPVAEADATEQHLTEVSIETMPAKKWHYRKARPRIGRDGKPLRERPKRQPNPEDVARAEMVEALLHNSDNKLFASSSPAKKEPFADDTMAADFEARFVDAANERLERLAKQNQNKEPQPTTGPRLGGSRSARVKMAVNSKP